MPTSDPLVFVRYLDVLLVVLAAPFVVLMGGPVLGYVVGARRVDRHAHPRRLRSSAAAKRPQRPARRSGSTSAS